MQNPATPYANQDSAALIHALGDALARRSRANSSAIVHALVQQRAPLGPKWKSMAAIAKQNGEVQDALAAMHLYADAVGRSPSVTFELAAVSAQLGQLADASILMDSVPHGTPNAASYYYSRGTLATNLGDFDAARSYLRAAVRAAPASGQSWLALAMAGAVAPEDAAALAAADMSAADPIETAAWHYAMGKMLDESGYTDSAFANFQQAAEIVGNQRPFNPEADVQHARASIAGWTPETIAAAHPALSKPSRPIFVTGLPRSGTTLVEQILASHSAVDGGEELGLMRLVTQDMGNTYADFEKFTQAGGDPAELSALYHHLLAQRYPGTGQVVDKTLNSSRSMGLIATLFPDAAIIWLRRDPLDCAWSAYRTWFLRGLSWSWSLDTIAAHFRIEDALFAHWTALLGERILVVDYAAMVSNPAPWIQRITEHCGLTLEPAQLSPHNTKRTVTTASVAQVREAINTRAVGAADAYRTHLQPFVDAYGARPPLAL